MQAPLLGYNANDTEPSQPTQSQSNTTNTIAVSPRMSLAQLSSRRAAVAVGASMVIFCLTLTGFLLVSSWRMSSSEQPDVIIVQDNNNDYASDFLQTNLCVDHCRTDCRQYVTPLHACFHGATLFPGDKSWNATVDIWDELINATHIRRVFYTPQQSCRSSDHTDAFELPLEQCVGPFGAPRPWGSFQLLSVGGAS